jgi:hypothetical protein
MTKDDYDKYNLDRLQLEQYMSDNEFLKIMKMSKSDFYSLPKWKKKMLKCETNLF